MGEMVRGYIKNSGEPLKPIRIPGKEFGAWVLSAARQLARPPQDELIGELRANELMQADARRQEAVSIKGRMLKSQTLVEPFLDGDKTDWHKMRENEAAKFSFIINTALRAGLHEMGLDPQDARTAISLYDIDMQRRLDAGELGED